MARPPYASFRHTEALGYKGVIRQGKEICWECPHYHPVADAASYSATTCARLHLETHRADFGLPPREVSNAHSE